MGETIRIVDLFCGCGGLAVGFELHRGAVTYQTVLAADIDPAALRTFNANISRSHGRVSTGRRCDLSWFTHRAEFLLYYLSHFAMWLPDAELSLSLYKLGFGTFLSRLRQLDEEFDKAASIIAGDRAYSNAWQRVDSAVSNLALYKAALRKLGLKSLRTPELDHAFLPWAEEYQLAAWAEARAEGPHPTLVDSAASLWAEQIERFEDAASKTGRGQHRTVAARMSDVTRFMRSDAVQRLRRLWIDWRAMRDTVRASFCLSVQDEIGRLYQAGREVQLVLGGPPCKGWSRIGRAVIESLRSQGVHAWASKQYGDERNALLHNYVLVLDALRPAAFLFENVAHFESSLDTPNGAVNAAVVLRDSLSALASGDLAFDIESRIVRAHQHGVPQYRHRFIMVGVRKTTSLPPRGLPSSSFFALLPRFDAEVPLKVALAGLDDPGVFEAGNKASCGNDHRVSATDSVTDRLSPPVKLFIDWIRQPSIDGEVPVAVDSHVVRRSRDDDSALYGFIAPGKRWMDYKLDEMPTLVRLRDLLSRAECEFAKRPAASINKNEISLLRGLLDDSFWLRLLLEALAPPTATSPGHHLIGSGYLVKGTDRHGDWLERLSPNKPSKTIVAHIGKDTYGYINPYQARPLSVREAARIQTFPDYFSFAAVGIVDSYAMIGNAVPPLLAKHFATAFEHLHASEALFNAPGTERLFSRPVQPKREVTAMRKSQSWRQSAK